MKKWMIASCALMLTSLVVPVGGTNAALPDATQTDTALTGAVSIDNLLMQTLGGMIFSDKNLSKQRNMSCMTCHDPSAGFADPVNQAYPTKFPVSEGSIPGVYGGRNAPSAAYAGFSPNFQYNGGLYFGGVFWDGRATGASKTLGDPMAEQALGPFLNVREMNLSGKKEVVDIIRSSKYSILFKQVFGAEAFDDDNTAYDNVGVAIAAFERSKVVTRFNSKFDKFWAEQGNDVSKFGVDGKVPPNFNSRYFNQQEALGLALFNSENKGKCALCHLTTNLVDNLNSKKYPPVFTDFTYDNLGIPVNKRIAKLAGAQPIDYGLGAKTDELIAANSGATIEKAPSGILDPPTVDVVAGEIGKFKVPTLRNVARSAPYGHNGYFATLKDITHFYNTRDIATWPKPEVVETVNYTELGNLGLTAKEEAAIVAFMKTLTD